MSEKDELYGEEASVTADGDEKLTVKRKKISVPTEEDVSAISMLTAEDFIFNGEDDKTQPEEDDGNTDDNGQKATEPAPDAVSDPEDNDIADIEQDEAAEEEYSPVTLSEEESDTPLELPSDGEELEFTSTNIFDDESPTEGATEQAAPTDEQAAEEAGSEKEKQFYLLEGDEGEEPVVTLTKKSRHSYNPDKPRRIDMAFDFLEIFVFSLVAVLVFTTFFFRHTIVEGPSMEQTLYGGEHLITTNLFYTPARGDIIVCEDFATGHHKPIVKRVIAVAGDTVEILPTCIKVNGVELPEPYVYTDDYDGFYTNDPSFCRKLTVGEGEIFVAGDHRSNSDDSRKFGPVKSDSVLGKVVLRFFPFDRFGIVK